MKTFSARETVWLEDLDSIELANFWQRALALKGSFGFVQFFMHSYRRCAQDRLSETIVVTEPSYQQRFPARLGIPSEADTFAL